MTQFKGEKNLILCMPYARTDFSSALHLSLHLVPIRYFSKLKLILTKIYKKLRPSALNYF